MKKYEKSQNYIILHIFFFKTPILYAFRYKFNQMIEITGMFILLPQPLNMVNRR